MVENTAETSDGGLHVDANSASGSSIQRNTRGTSFDEAREALAKIIMLINKLTRVRRGFTKTISQIADANPMFKASLSAIEVIMKIYSEDEGMHKQATELVERLDIYLQIIGETPELRKNKVCKRAVETMLGVIKEIAENMSESKNNAGIFGKDKHRERMASFSKQFERAKEQFDAAVAAETFRMVSDESRLRSQLQVSNIRKDPQSSIYLLSGLSQIQGWQANDVHTDRPISDEAKQSQDILHQLLERLGCLDLTTRLSTEDRRVHIALGGYGDVYTAYLWIGGQKIKVALKQLRFFLYKEPRFARLLAKEMRIWSELCHPNILAFLGYIIEENGMPSLISEWMENGTILTFVKAHPETNILPMVLGIAQGLEYLHNRDVVHSDIKSNNVLISEAGVPLICDFGTSRMLAATQTLGGNTMSGRPRGSLRWLAAELCAGVQSEHTKESDVWAFGMTAYELLVRDWPYHHIRLDHLLIAAIVRGEKPQEPEGLGSASDVVRNMWHMCNHCWTDEPEKRWPMSGVVSFLMSKADAPVHTVGS